MRFFSNLKNVKTRKLADYSGRSQVLSTVDDDHHLMITHPAFVYSMMGNWA